MLKPSNRPPKKPWGYNLIMEDDAHERLLRDESIVPESVDTDRMPINWGFEPETLRNMSAEERLAYDIETAEKMRRLAATFHDLGVMLAAAGISLDGESPRAVVERNLNPDKFDQTRPPAE